MSAGSLLRLSGYRESFSTVSEKPVELCRTFKSSSCISFEKITLQSLNSFSVMASECQVISHRLAVTSIVAMVLLPGNTRGIRKVRGHHNSTKRWINLNNTCLNTRIQRLLDGLIFIKKTCSWSCSACSKWVGVNTLAKILSKMFGKNNKLTPMFWQTNDLVQTYFY